MDKNEKERIEKIIDDLYEIDKIFNKKSKEKRNEKRYKYIAIFYGAIVMCDLLNRSQRSSEETDYNVDVNALCSVMYTTAELADNYDLKYIIDYIECKYGAIMKSKNILGEWENCFKCLKGAIE